MSKVVASAAEVRKLAAALKRYEEEVKEASKKVEGAINSAAGWSDPKKDQFAVRYREHHKQVDRFMSSQVEDMVRTLNEFARRLDELERMKM